MKAKTCPHCDYTYSTMEYLKRNFLWSPVWKSKKCINCDKPYKPAIIRRFIIAIGFVIVLILYINLLSYLGVGSVLKWILMVPFMFFVFWLFSNFEIFKTIEE